MKNNIWKSFRLEIVVYSMLSMFFTLVTIAVLLLGSGIVYISLGGENLIHSSVTTYEETNMQNSGPEKYKSDNPGVNNKAKEKDDIEPPKRADHRMMIIIGICLGILGVFLFIYYFLRLTKKFSQYMVTLSEGIDEISQGNFRHPIEIDSKDEFGSIAEKMNQMTKDINQIIETNRSGEDRKHELITSVAHDLRTPLTSVIGYLELIRSSKVDEDTKARYLEIVYQKSKRLEQLIEDLFSYTKYTYGNVATITQPVDVVKLLEQLLDEFYPSFEDNKLTCQIYKDCQSLVSYADGNLLARAFANLISNAIKYGAEGKKVEIFFVHHSNDMSIIVKNYGTIIPEKDLPHIFDRFYRVEDSRSQETGGSGLGLAIAKSIAVMHHGDITAKSSLNGTVFEVKLPIIREPET